MVYALYTENCNFYSRSANTLNLNAGDCGYAKGKKGEGNSNQRQGPFTQIEVEERPLRAVADRPW